MTFAGAAPAVGRADAPANDVLSGAVALDATHSTVSGTTAGATLEKTDPASVCNETLAASVWYVLSNVPARSVVLRLTAQPGLSAVVSIYHVRNGRIVSEWMIEDLLSVMQQVGAVPAPS